MMTAAFAGFVAFAIMGSLSVSGGRLQLAQAAAQEAPIEASIQATGSVNAAPVVTEAKIARIKRALRLTSEQEVHWRPVESTLRKIAQRVRSEDGAGVVQRVRNKVAGYASHASAYQQVASVAGPLIASLDENQKRDGMRLIRELGLR